MSARDLADTIREAWAGTDGPAAGLTLRVEPDPAKVAGTIDLTGLRVLVVGNGSWAGAVLPVRETLDAEDTAAAVRACLAGLLAEHEGKTTP